MTEYDRADPEFGPDWRTAHDLPDQALICGSAPCLFEEFEEASAILPDAAVLVVNEAGRVIRGDHLMTQHPEKASWFRERSINPAITIHTGKPRERACQPDIDVYWPDCVTLATSGGSAIAIALRMSFERIVLCGMPMNGGDGYFSQSAMETDEPRFGLESAESDYIQAYKDRLIDFAATHPEALQRVRSLSGFTREIFGAPEWQA
ncbi:hypothetical protein [Wenzhouxiangella sp. EGI_FJ10305]|uniref:hypothetical protein n=1 Tax=Wenzhouxiangella sp. EGI_FJ10305 TaxID=3243768 RepID=UPI0035DB613A